VENEPLVALLNRMLAMENAAVIRLASHAAVCAGPGAEQLRSQSREAQERADRLRSRILGLGGSPSLAVDPEGLVPAGGLDQALEVDRACRERAVRGYGELLDAIPRSNEVLFDTVQQILREEQRELEELGALG